MARYVIDPVTRIEGHLRLEVTTGTNGTIDMARSTGTMFRGIEQIMMGRDPRDAWVLAQRACGVCTHVHAIASIRAVESALGITAKIPNNARILRNLMCATQTVQDHIIHFYHLHALDWVDITVALKADPVKTASLASKNNVGWKNNSSSYFTAVKQKLANFANSGDLGPFASGYWGHPAYMQDAEASLLLVAHFLEALDFQREIVKIHAYIGGKNPHPQTYVVGGMATTFGANMPSGVNSSNLQKMRTIAQNARRFVDQVLVPDVKLVAKTYKALASSTSAQRQPSPFTYGVGLKNMLAYGDLPLSSPESPSSYLFPQGRIKEGKYTELLRVDQAKITESVAHSWYAGADARNPYTGVTQPTYTGPQPPFETIETEKYSWLKAPRYDGVAYEVGPLARMMVGYAAGKSNIRSAVDGFCSAVGISKNDMFSTMGRLAARALETQVLVPYLDTWLAELQKAQAAGNNVVAIDVGKPSSWPSGLTGWGTTEAPRGALGHWIKIDNGVVSNYQMVVATTWNGSPRDADNNPGAWEKALVGNPLRDGNQPVEILRTVHSFDPCMGCSVHVLDPDAAEPIAVVQVV